MAFFPVSFAFFCKGPRRLGLDFIPDFTRVKTVDLYFNTFSYALLGTNFWPVHLLDVLTNLDDLNWAFRSILTGFLVPALFDSALFFTGLFSSCPVDGERSRWLSIVL